jgi:hypothetical protein
MAEADPRSSGSYRAALTAVIILSVLLVAGLAAVAAGFVRQYRLYQARHPAPMAAVATMPAVGGAAASVILAPGAHIVSVATDAGKLVLHVQTPEGAEVDIMDLGSGRLTAQVKDGPLKDGQQ